MRHIIVCGFWFVDYYECTNNCFRTIKCIGSSFQWKQKEMSHYGAQEDMMAEQGLLGICWNGKERSQVWENVFTGKAASIKTFKTVQVPYSLWDVTKVASGIHDDTNMWSIARVKMLKICTHMSSVREYQQSGI